MGSTGAALVLHHCGVIAVAPRPGHAEDVGDGGGEGVRDEHADRAPEDAPHRFLAHDGDDSVQLLVHNAALHGVAA